MKIMILLSLSILIFAGCSQKEPVIMDIAKSCKNRGIIATIRVNTITGESECLERHSIHFFLYRKQGNR